jgi:hypothetical protein
VRYFDFFGCGRAYPDDSGDCGTIRNRVASVSKTLLKTARGLLASALEKRHSLKEFLLAPQSNCDLRALMWCSAIRWPWLWFAAGGKSTIA